MTARRPAFAAIVVLLHVLVVAGLLSWRERQPPGLVTPAMVALVSGGEPAAARPAPMLPVDLRPAVITPPLPQLVQVPMEAVAVAPTVAATGPQPSVAAGPGESPGFVQDLDYLVPLELNYPRSAKRRRAQGMVYVYVLVGHDGMPWDVKLYRGSGHPDLDEEALRAVRKALFRPKVIDGMARPVRALVPVNFHLEDRSGAAMAGSQAPR